MIDSLIKAIKAEPEEDKVAKEVIYEYIKTSERDIEDFKADAYLQVGEEIPFASEVKTYHHAKKLKQVKRNSPLLEITKFILF